MENLQIIKGCPWVSDVIDFNNYFDCYHQTLDDANGMKDHTKEFKKNKSMRDFFHLLDDFSAPSSQRTTPAYLKRSSSSADAQKEKQPKFEEPSSVEGTPDIQSPPLSPPEDSLQDDPFNLEELEKNCSIDLLTVEGELPPREVSQDSVPNSGRITNWYAGTFSDGIIPDGSSESLSTLESQSKELYKREISSDYAKNRQRALKYNSTVRMLLKDETNLEDIPSEEASTTSCLRDVIFNIRIQRPYYRTTANPKVLSKFPRHTQEILMLGSQKLVQLKDVIVCINDYFIHSDVSENPNGMILQEALTLKRFYPSCHFYINGCLYYDERPPAKDLTSTIRNWADKTHNVDPISSDKMGSTKLIDLKLRLGYPYLYQHLGNCEHLITFTDARLIHRTDIQNPSRYPLSRGSPLKIVAICVACALFKASWLLKDHKELPVPYAHFCNKCLKEFFYDKDMKKLGDFKLFPFIDEYSARKHMDKNINEDERPDYTIELTGNLY